MAKRLTPRPASAEPSRAVQVWDREHDRAIDVPAERAELFRIRLAGILKNTVEMCIDLADIAEQELYRTANYDSFKQFVILGNLPFGYGAAKMYVSVGRRLIDMYGSVDDAKRSIIDLVNGETAQISQGDASAVTIQKLGITKLYAVRELPDADLRHIIETGKVQIGEGEYITVEDLLDRHARAEDTVLAHTVEKLRAKEREVQQLQEQLKLKDSEAEADTKLIAEAERKLAKADELERLYGEANNTYEANDRTLTEIDHHARELRRRLFNLGLTEDSAQGHKNKLVELLREIISIGSAAEIRFKAVIHSADDTIAESGMYAQAFLARVEADAQPAPADAAPDVVVGKIGRE